jgi:enoyl-CoA hydratase/carnithine racemase
MLETDKIISKKEQGIGWLVFNNPERRNAMSLEMWRATAQVLKDFEEDPAVRVIVMHGAGGKAFLSGADISQFEDVRKNAEQQVHYASISEEGKRRMTGLTKPLIAMIQGFCVGGGLGVAINADIRIASDDSQFAVPAAKLGLAYDFKSLKRLVDLVGPAFAKEIMFTGRRLKADEALRIGLVNRLVPVGDLETTVRELAAEIAGNAPLTLRSAKLTINQAVLDPDDRDMKSVEHAFQNCFDSKDYEIGRKAFMEKRAPEFTGT